MALPLSPSLMRLLPYTLFSFLLFAPSNAQTFQRLGTCPTLGCIFPPDQTDFLPGQLFDIRLEVHSPVNGTEAFNGGVVDEKFQFCITKVDDSGPGKPPGNPGKPGKRDAGDSNSSDGDKHPPPPPPPGGPGGPPPPPGGPPHPPGGPGGPPPPPPGPGGNCVDIIKFFGKGVQDPALEKWSFSYTEDLFARDAGQSTVVNVASKVYRALSINDPGSYQAKLTYNGKSTTVANWVVRDISKKRKAKNVLFFIGDGMTQPMITAARLIGHKSINGKYQSLMQLDQMEALGHQMTHSVDSFITDSANSATALYTGKKSSVNALNVYVDSSKDVFDDPKVETIAELFRRKIGGALGIVSTAYIADATPAALCAHTRDRGQSAAVIVEYLNDAQTLTPNIKWPTSCKQPDVIFGGGAEYFFPGKNSPNGTDYYKAFADKGYQVVYSNTELKAAKTDQKTLGIFSVNNLAKWLDRNVKPENLKNQASSPKGDGGDALDQPGLKDMTLKAIDILQARTKGDEGWFMMSEAASIDKMMHVLDYDRALGELLELDDTIRASIDHLDKIGELDNTLIVVTADHGHGFDVFGSSDTKYLKAQATDRKKRGAIGVYANSGLSGYMAAEGSSPNNNTIVYGAQGPNFPVQWNPRYAFAAGFGAAPDHRETFALNEDGPRSPAVSGPDGVVVNPKDNVDGFTVTGTLPTTESQGVHSLQDVSVFANGPGSDTFRGVYNSVDIFFKIADALGLGA